MTDIINANGSATYSVDVPAPLEIIGQANRYHVAGGTGPGDKYIVDTPEQAADMRAAAAVLIAVADAADLRREQQTNAARDQLAQVLYETSAGGSGGVPRQPWANTNPTTRDYYRGQADALIARGVIVGSK